MGSGAILTSIPNIKGAPIIISVTGAPHILSAHNNRGCLFIHIFHMSLRFLPYAVLCQSLHLQDTRIRQPARIAAFCHRIDTVPAFLIPFFIRSDHRACRCHTSDQGCDISILFFTPVSSLPLDGLMFL